MNLYGRTYRRREIEARVARLETLGGVRRFSLAEGREAGVEMIQVRTGAGLAYNLNVSRCLDISLAELAGVPLSWQSSAGDVHPSYYDAENLGWAAGGLLMTCGLTQVGSPCEDQGEKLGQHGSIHHLPARQVAVEASWEGDEYLMRVAGVVEQTALFGDTLRLTRRVQSRLGENSIAIRDVVENAGFKPAPLMLLYHFNFGFPLLSEHTTLAFPSQRVVPRESELTLEGIGRWEPPQENCGEKVYYHEDLKTDSRGWTEVSIRNPRFPLVGVEAGAPVSVRLKWASGNLPRFVQWKMPASGVYALGVEPANCHVEGRAEERKRGTLLSLEPGESQVYELELRVNVE